ncbi:MAG: universal stress protein [Balneolaceae bacterium]
MNAKNILVPTDLSQASLEGVKMAVTLAELNGGTIHLIHVIPLMSYYTESIDNLGLPLDMEKELYPKALQRVNKKLHDIAEELIPKEHRGLLVDQVGRKPWRVIAEQANNGDYDLVIMSNKGGHEVDAVRSNITEKVIRFSEIPVLSVTKAFTKTEVNDILVPIDGSKDANAALVPAFELAEQFDAGITLIHIVEPYTLGMEVIPPFMEDDEAIYSSLIENISKYFEEKPTLGFSIQRSGIDFEDYLIREEGSDSVSIKFVTVVKKGFSPHTEISEHADENSDLVVMSTHGRTGISRVILGSTTGMIAQHLNHSLYTFRPVKHSE